MIKPTAPCAKCNRCHLFCRAVRPSGLSDRADDCVGGGSGAHAHPSPQRTQEDAPGYGPLPVCSSSPLSRRFFTMVSVVLCSSPRHRAQRQPDSHERGSEEQRPGVVAHGVAVFCPTTRGAAFGGGRRDGHRAKPPRDAGYPNNSQSPCVCL